MKASCKGLATLNVKALTWLRDSHGLFDYESFQLVKNTLKAEGNSTIVRYGDEVSLKNDLCPESGEIEELAYITYTNGISTVNNHRKVLYF